MSSSVYCGKCSNKYSNRFNWATHFTQQKVKSQKPGISHRLPNLCYNTNDPRVCDKDLDKAVKEFQRQLKQRKFSETFFPSIKPTGGCQTSSHSSTKEQTPASKKRKIETSDDHSDHNNNLPIPKSNDTGKQFVENQTTNNLKDTQATLPTVPLTAEEHSKIDLIEEKLTALLKETSINNDLLKKVHNEVMVKKTISKIPIPVKPKMTSKDQEQYSLTSNLSLISSARSMKQLCENPLIKCFKLLDKQMEVELPQLPEVVERNLADEEVHIVDEELLKDQHPVEENQDLEKAEYQLYCTACNHSNYNVQNKTQKNLGFDVKDPNYSCAENKNQQRWFVNLKKNLKRHVAKLRHHQRLASYQVINNYNLNSEKQVQKICSNILYYMIKSNSPSSMYPVILAVIFRSGFQVGNYNHSPYTYRKMLRYIDQQLKEESKIWFKNQTSVSITADIGTVRGITLLVVLLLSETDDKTVFVGMNPISSKAGIYCADQIVDILKSENYLNLKICDLKTKVSGLVCDGAFVKENKPFKNRMKHHLGDNLHFRWDPLHMMNRAHIAAMDSQRTKFNLNTVMDYIQNHSKQFRTGLEYTKLQLEQMFAFRRPKLKSETRLVNYDYNQVFRFLENQIWFDHPSDMLQVSRIYVLIALVTKVILGISQKTDVTTEYIRSVFYEGQGKDTMKLALDMGFQMICDESISVIIDDHRPTPISESGNKFANAKDYIINELCNFLKQKGDKIVPPPEPTVQGRTRAKKAFNSAEAKDIVSKYIDDLWDEIADRLFDDTDGTTRWSEAPSETIFSTLEYVVEDKPSLTYENSVALCRIVKEAPPPGTNQASKITVSALDCWKNESKSGGAGHFTTNNWMLGTVSETVSRAYNK